jgi:HKD family nuclease
MSASDPVAVDKLAALPNATLKISYEENATRLHAKAWMFHRASGFSTA